ncbi:MAG: acyl-CoA thioesterase [Solobacterium sp.]|jgi:acyl-CoA hydrolase|nr:acyl-CoA thioesterase [Solobacterium sp.]
MAEVTTSVQIVLSQHCNGDASQRLFGGQLMAWIDVIGAVAARRYTHTAVTTVCVDNLNFLRPAHLNDILVQEAKVTWTGNTSLEVRVDSFVEKEEGRELINRAYLVFVAIGDDERPVRIPEYMPETPEEEEEYSAAVERKIIRMQR